jgi:hypothetical protein
MLRANVWNNNIEVCNEQDIKIKIAGKDYSLTELLVWEAKSVIKDGGKIDHPSWGSKDVLDSLSILNYNIMQLEIQGVMSDISMITEDELKRYCDLFMKEKYKLIQERVPEAEMLPIISKILLIKLRECEKIAEIVKERYNY